ncbi:hypothetical protein BURMUCGD1_2856 [Burkholderia multivorans CGD1]|nr:hypothetical protein BURMUCGD1_2856 [Burkholderia multivorans CGD1]
MVLGRQSKSRSGFAGGAAGSTWVSTRNGAQRPVLTAATRVAAWIPDRAERTH